jgi:hypothetical protein
MPCEKMQQKSGLGWLPGNSDITDNSDAETPITTPSICPLARCDDAFLVYGDLATVSVYPGVASCL